MNLQFVPANKVEVKDETWCQTLGQFSGVYFPDLNSNSYYRNNKKFDLDVSTKVKFEVSPGL